MKDIWEETPQSKKKQIPLTSYKTIQFSINPSDFEPSIEESSNEHFIIYTYNVPLSNYTIIWGNYEEYLGRWRRNKRLKK